VLEDRVNEDPLKRLWVTQNVGVGTALTVKELERADSALVLNNLKGFTSTHANANVYVLP
jgi:hypothetical protein